MSFENYGKTLASYLLQIKAIQINVQNPFTWTSGWRSPIYCDNRKVLSYPEVRNFVKEQLSALVKVHFNPTIIAGVATAGIPHGALVADELDLPYIYVRSKAKSHGLQNKIEGDISTGNKVVVVEDTISTGKSSLEAVDALEAAGMEVIGMIALYSYNFPSTNERFKNRNLKVLTIANYNDLLNAAIETNVINEASLTTLAQWRNDPQNWKP